MPLLAGAVLVAFGPASWQMCHGVNSARPMDAPLRPLWQTTSFRIEAIRISSGMVAFSRFVRTAMTARPSERRSTASTALSGLMAFPWIQTTRLIERGTDA